ncbi:unnamed protein product [Moneuplotes crassus]|uniref:Uncharacterized protein n=1 Tax=Euplotes crassus TaxID=5936 RepID=A0AAD1UCC0_EUPCR|nr:unnamed protein product [Moneuplotes crassus]
MITFSKYCQKCKIKLREYYCPCVSMTLCSQCVINFHQECKLNEETKKLVNVEEIDQVQKSIDTTFNIFFTNRKHYDMSEIDRYFTIIEEEHEKWLELQQNVQLDIFYDNYLNYDKWLKECIEFYSNLKKSEAFGEFAHHMINHLINDCCTSLYKDIIIKETKILNLKILCDNNRKEKLFRDRIDKAFVEKDVLIEDMKGKQEQMTQEIAQLKEQLLKKTEEFEASQKLLSEEIENKNKITQEKEVAIQEKQDEIETLNKEVNEIKQNLENVIKEKQDKITEYEGEINQKNTVIEQNNATVNEHKASIERLEKEIEDLKTQITQASSQGTPPTDANAPTDTNPPAQADNSTAPPPADQAANPPAQAST